MTSKEIMARFQLPKTKLDYILRKFASPWGLKRDQAGNFVWDDLALTKLEAYLTRQGDLSRSGVIEQAQVTSGEAAVLAIAEGLGKRLDSIQSSQTGLATRDQVIEILATQTANYQKEIAEMRAGMKAQSDAISTMASELIAVRRLVTPRVERRREPGGLIDWLYRVWFMVPVPDRRQG
jgi:hypothetical protein